MYSSPVRSTPLDGVAVAGSWKYQSFKCSPAGMDVRKKLFYGEKDASASSEYFTQSIEECSGMSGGSQTNLFSDSSPSSAETKVQVQVSLVHATPPLSPCKRPTSSTLNFSSPPRMKKQRLFFPPSSPTTPDKFPACFHSPVRPTASPIFNLDSSSDSMMLEMVAKGDTSGHEAVGCSPPRMERLQLFDYPRTPLSIARSCGLTLQSEFENFSSKQQQQQQQQQQQEFDDTNRTTPRHHVSKSTGRGRRRINHCGVHWTRRASRGTNINPFTPAEIRGMMQSANPSGAESGSSPMLVKSAGSKPRKKLALRESNISRYREEFHEVCVIGSGSFGTVYKCINRLDGCLYALKKSHKPVAGSSAEPAALREVCAHAVLGSHPHLVRYYSAWAENDHMLIQNEYCDGGNLTARIRQNHLDGRNFGEGELKRLLRHLSQGIQYIHSMGLVHLDIKPDNIFISSVRDAPGSYISDSNEEPMDTLEEGDTTPAQFLYKIGDMGLVTSLTDPQVEDGDCRYLSRELLQDNYEHLTKADVFSLGLTVFQAGDGRELPKNGDEWHRIRDGILPSLPTCSSAFNNLLQLMIHKDPTQRPSPSELLSLPTICPFTDKSKAQLRKELNEEKFKNEVLLKKLKQAREQPVVEEKPVCGPKLNRSMSIA